MNVYIACGLTHVPRDEFSAYVDFIHRLAGYLQSHAAHRVRYALVDSDPQLSSKPAADRARLCYRWDRDMVEESDVVVAEASFPSIGVGIELQIAAAKGIPIIICFRDAASGRAAPVDYITPDGRHHDLQIGEGFVTLMALGLPTVYQVIKYHQFDEGLVSISNAVRATSKELP